jgi:puromycin-sensitive aminopeptidase
MKNKKTKSVRLPSHISPVSYRLNLWPDLESFTYKGNETIKIKIDKEINKITIHSKDIDIETVKIWIKDCPQFASKITYDIERETATFCFKNKIKVGYTNIHISFKGIINDGLRGFYRSRYVLNEEEKYLATTQFEATDARRAFPCFDEPEHKATFEVSLIIADKHTAISNTLPIEIKEHSAGYKIISFAPTPRMSTYLLAFIIGEFEYVEGQTKENVQVRVFTTTGKKHQAKFALEVAIKSLEFYNEYFDIPYPLPTLDLIAIPDFESAAMENWGAVTFRETAILVDEDNTSLSNKQWVAIVIAHELAHQWFGNLVTMRWWTDLWLNEGFATYMETFCVDKLFPEWHLWDLYIADRYALALRLDSLASSHPIEIKVNHPNEINEIFDMVSYAKGGAMIRQIAEYIGHDKFQIGLQHYLKKHSYKNTDTVDLWNSFEKVSKKPISKMMSLWTKEIGYPLVTLSPRQGLGENWMIEQERFFSSRISKKEYYNSKKKNHLWPIPIKYESLSRLAKADNNETLSLLMTKKRDPLIGTNIGKINKEEETFMRVRYDEATLKKLGEEIVNGKLSVKDRLGIIRDLFALAEGGYIKTDVALEFALNYKDETEYIVWVEIAGGINKIYNLIYNENFVSKYETYARSLFSPLANKMSFEKKKNERHSDTFLRSLAIAQTGFYGDKKIINEAKKLWNERDSKPIHADIRNTIFRIIASNGGEKEWKIFEKLYKEEKMHEEKDRYGYALTSFKDKTLIEKTLKFIMGNDVKTQDAPHLLASLWQNPFGRDLTWQFVKNNWEILLKKYGEGGHFLSRLLSPLGNHPDLKTLKGAQKFFAENTAPGADRSLSQSYEKIASNSAWIKDDKKIIKKWIEKNY